MTIYVPLMDQPTSGASQLDGQAGTILFLSGLDKPEAQAAFALYQQQSARAGAAFDATTLRVTDGATIIQFAWETDIAMGQTGTWVTVWTEFAIESRLFPSQFLIDAINAIITAQRVT